VNQALWCVYGRASSPCFAARCPHWQKSGAEFNGRKVFTVGAEPTLVGGSLMVQPLRNGYIRGVARGPFPVTPSHADSFLL
jgi:hypothetical protein